jgi:hypothetical protein
MHKTAPKTKEKCKICSGKGYHKLSCPYTKVHVIDMSMTQSDVSDQPKI